MPTTETTPEIGKFYSARGFEFRVDDLKNGDVYLTRWRGDAERGVPFRVTIATWNRQMADAEKIPAIQVNGENDATATV